jgi:hypothetical protein
MTVSTLRDWGHSLPVNDHLPKPSARLRTRLAFLRQPGYAKIVWTLEADAVSENESIARTRIRVKTTDPLARSSHLRELGWTRTHIDAIWRACPMVILPGTRRPVLRVDDYLAYLEEHTPPERSAARSTAAVVSYQEPAVSTLVSQGSTVTVLSELTD